MTRSGGRDWTKIAALILAALSLLSSVGWAAYGLSAKARDDVLNRIGELERKMTAIDAITPIRREMRDRQFQALDDRLRALEARR